MTLSVVSLSLSSSSKLGLETLEISLVFNNLDKWLDKEIIIMIMMRMTKTTRVDIYEVYI
jgi:galactitol-specific phosphotransferase system IIC component